MRFYKYILFFLLITQSAYTQRLFKLTTQVDGQTEYISFLSRNGMTYFSGNEAAKIFSGNFFFNNKTSKIEIKFAEYSVTFAARNKFVIIRARNSSGKFIYQMPVYPLLIKDDIFLPAEFCMEYFSIASGKEFVYNNDTKNISAKINSSVPKPDVPVIVNQMKPDLNESEAIGKSSKYDIFGIEIEEKVNGTLIRLKSNKKIYKYGSSIKDDILYVFLNDVSLDPSIAAKVKKTGIIKSAVSKKITNNNQLEFKLGPGYSSHEAFQDPAGDDLLISIHNDMFSSETYNPDGDKEKWKFDVVVIDPGHGGKDAGAIGVTGTKEKDINLKIGLKLGELIKKNLPEVKVVYTRSSDEFVELYKRGKIANEKNGKLFISIHCNSLKRKPSNVSGYEVYLLRPGKTKDAIEIAEFENSVISYEDNPDRYQKLDDENFILVSMAHSSYMRHSEEFSDILNNELERLNDIPSRGIKQAGFYVLVGASMPGILFETGFLSNRKDEKYLKSKNGQEKIANKMFEAVKRYKNYYDKLIAEGV